MTELQAETCGLFFAFTFGPDTHIYLRPVTLQLEDLINDKSCAQHDIDAKACTQQNPPERAPSAAGLCYEKDAAHQHYGEDVHFG